jgi:hypothetical protein
VLVDRAVGGSSLNWASKTTCCPCFGLGQIVKAQALVGFSRVGFFILLFLKKNNENYCVNKNTNNLNNIIQ